MSSRIASGLNPAVVLGTLALIVSLTGTAFAAGLISGGDVKNGSLTGKDVKNKSLTRADFKGSVQGPKGDQGVPGAALAYAHVNSNGTLDAANSKNIANYANPGALPSNHCFDVSVPVQNVVAVPEGVTSGELTVSTGDPFGDCTGFTTDFTVFTFNSAGSAIQHGFYVVFN